MIVVVGVSHHTAPIELREKVALSAESEERLLAELSADPRVAEVFVVSTCNRVELVAVARSATSEAQLDCVDACRSLLLQKAPGLTGHLYARSGSDGMRHLLRVASSLDSLVVGEPQILGQLKQGFERARERGTIGPTLHRAFAHAVRGAKRVRTETQLGAGQVSVPSIAVDLARQIFGDLRGHQAALLGSGEMAEAVAKLLLDAGARISVVGRNPARVAELANKFGGEGYSLDQLDAVLVAADVVVTSTSATEPLIRRDRVARLRKARKARKGRSLFFIDLAVPRDVEASVGELDGVFLYNVDDLSGVASGSAEIRRKEAARAHQLVESALENFERWQSGEQATPVIKGLRGKLRAALEQELDKSLRGRLSGLGAE
ncbi:MAG TPA: glutamyl-tRNA reductase, partial [Polyangiaceae bacterium]|nr:glutamyl-tRNA reductase [Polyangiaceae bacterium]